MNHQKVSNHHVFAEQKLDDQHDEHVRLNHRRKKTSPPFTLSDIFQYQKLLYWIPVLAAIALIAFGVIRESLSEQEKYYCYKSNFLSSNFDSLARSSNKRQVLVNTRYSFKLLVDSYDNNTSKKITQTGTSDPVAINVLGHIINFDDNVLIVGDNIGLQSTVAGKVVGGIGHVYVTSPIQYNSKLLSKNFQLNQILKHTTIYRVEPTAGKSENVRQVIQSVDWKKEPPTFDYKKEQIQGDKLDNILPSTVVLDFIFINSLKNQIKVLEGLKQTIRRSSSQLVLMVKWSFEKGGAVTIYQYEQMVNFMANLGYKFYSYKGGSFKTCALGAFILQKDLTNRPNNRQQFILFFPKGYSLPR